MPVPSRPMRGSSVYRRKKPFPDVFFVLNSRFDSVHRNPRYVGFSLPSSYSVIVVLKSVLDNSAVWLITRTIYGSGRANNHCCGSSVPYVYHIPSTSLSKPSKGNVSCKEHTEIHCHSINSCPMRYVLPISSSVV